MEKEILHTPARQENKEEFNLNYTVDERGPGKINYIFDEKK